MIVIDTETTGVNSTKDELLQISIIDDKGETLFNSYICPTHTNSWENAMKVNKISPLMVSSAPTVDEVREEIQEIIDKTDEILGYNVEFDLGFLRAAGIEITKPSRDVMREIGKKDNGRWWRLTDIAEKLGFDYSTMEAHNSLTDCLATLFVWNVTNKDVRLCGR